MSLTAGFNDFLDSVRSIGNNAARTTSDLLISKNYVSGLRESTDARALAVPTATPFTPVWAARDNAERQAAVTGSYFGGGSMSPVVALGLAAVGLVLLFKFAK